MEWRVTILMATSWHFCPSKPHPEQNGKGRRHLFQKYKTSSYQLSERLCKYYTKISN